MDKSGFLLFELTCRLSYEKGSLTYSKNTIRKFCLYDKDGRGMFDNLNDKYYRNIDTRKKTIRFLSTSIALRHPISDEYSFLLNFEGFNYNLELIDLKTFEITKDNLFDLSSSYGFNGFSPDKVDIPSIFLLELNNRKTLFGMYYYNTSEEYCNPRLALLVINLNYYESILDIYSLDFTVSAVLDKDFDLESKFFIIQTGNDYLMIDLVLKNQQVVLAIGKLFNYSFDFKTFNDYIFKWAFHKLLLLKDEISLLCYYSSNYTNQNVLTVYILELNYYYNNTDINVILKFNFETELKEGQFWYTSDIIQFNENRIILVNEKLDGTGLSIYIFDFFENYKYYIINKFYIKFYSEKISLSNRYSLLFKYKETLGLLFESINGENGFILFGYYSSYDPGHILDLKKDGLNYEINLGNYLNLQSNVFEYEIKYIKIIKVPNDESGIYIISNNKELIKANDCVDINTYISLYFSYNGIVKQGNYTFEFVGILQEPEYEKLKNYTDKTVTNINENLLIKKYIKIYNERRNLDIAGKLASIQINALNDIKVFCDTKYDSSSIKSYYNKLLTCWKGKFYDVINENEITQLDLGPNYHFDYINHFYIKCPKNCETCSEEQTSSNNNCIRCNYSFILRDGLCLEEPLSKYYLRNEENICIYNYYYDINFDLINVEKGNYYPDYKPYENKKTCECIQKCNIHDYDCNPTNNPFSIKKTYEQILSNIQFYNNTKNYSIIGHNVSFIFTNTDLEKQNLNQKDKTSVLLGDCEKILKKYYSLSDN